MLKITFTNSRFYDKVEKNKKGDLSIMKLKSKFMHIVAIFLITTICLTGCGKVEENRDGISRIESPEAGLVFEIAEEYLEKGLELQGPFEDYEGNQVMGIFWYYKPIIDPLLEEMMALSQEERTEEKLLEFYEQMEVYQKCVMGITLMEEQKYREAIESGKKIEDLSYWNPAEEFGTNDGYVYLLSIPENDTSGMKEEEKKQYEECSAYMQTVKENLIFMKRSIATGLPAQMPAFTAKDLDGNAVTESIFGEKDLTVVNIWGTFCTPCVEEMPELGEWAKTMPENVQLVGIIVDISGDNDTEHHDLAVAITEKAKADFVQIIANAELDSIMRWVTGVPTTLFVDKEGNLVGEPIIGADVEGYKEFVEEYLNGQ